MLQKFSVYDQSLADVDEGKVLINTINAHSYNVTGSDPVFREALLKSDVLIPDGISIVWAIRWLTGKRIKKIAGADLFFYEMKRLQKKGGKCFFLGSAWPTLGKIKARAKNDFPDVQVETFSPPFKLEFSAEESDEMIDKINIFKPDVLFIGMTAPKQEKWAFLHLNEMDAGHICCIGAVFDFYAGTIKRAPDWMIGAGFEWFYRFIREPRRMWHRYMTGNVKFIWSVLQEKFTTRKMKDGIA